MIDRTLKVITVNPFEAVASMRVGDLLEIAVPARSFLSNAKISIVERRAVDRLRGLHDLVQRDFAGEKRRNAQGALADYIAREWMTPKPKQPTPGFLGPFVLYFPDQLTISDDTAHISSKGMFLDGESRGEGLLVNVERMPDQQVEELLRKTVAIHIVHGIDDPKVIAKYFADVNGKGVGVNPNLVVMADYTDPYAEAAQWIFEKLGIELEKRQRQVPTHSNAVFTGLQARLMVAAVAKGVVAVQYGAKPIPADEVDFTKLRSVAAAWLKQVFTRFGPESFRDKAKVLRAGPVIVSLGALGRSFYTDDHDQQRIARQALNDKKIDWSIGDAWAGIAGKINPQTGKFTVGGGKEYAYATYNALTSRDATAWQQIRGIKPDTTG